MKKLLLIIGIGSIMIIGGHILLAADELANYQTPPAQPAAVPSAPVPVSENDINVNAPQVGQRITSPLIVEGQAMGNWYFEASFPVKLLDGNGKVLAQVPAQAQEEWMTDKMVPFKATLTFATPTTSVGTLIFNKDNPSGMPERDYSVKMEVKF